MTTTIHSNGSKWAGEAPDTLADLLKVLASHPLDRNFEQYGNFIYAGDPAILSGTTRFWGNFFTISHVFNIDTDEPEVIDALTRAIRANQQRQDYLAQPDPEQARRNRQEREEAKLAAMIEKRKEEARRLLGIT